MPNCTAYAFGRIYELNGSRPNLCTGNAEMWYDYNKSHNYYPYGSTPKLGAVAVWVHPAEVMLRLSKKLKTIQLHILTQRITVLIFILVLHHYPIRAMLEQLIGLYRDIYTHIHRLSAIQVRIVNNLSAPQFERQFATFFEAKGFNKAMICGMLGNIFRETSYLPSNYFAGYVPDAFGAVGNSVAYACGTEITVQDLSETARIGELM